MTPKQWKRLFARTLLWAGFLVGGAILIVFAFTTWNVYIKEREARIQHKNEVHALSELSNRKATLTENLQKFDTPRGIEEEVRKRFPVAKPGEEEIMLIAPKPTPKATSTSSATFWKGLLGWWPW
ncbi:MAG: hypothetical protein Greene07147_69 [Parcubacteria group bacterium Greene0714_7]|nr:MAG: hypothetical protein Greene07147_69 [Parcubacteria group bacterium Greene0714_7]